ncbi:MAG: hypothetical protein V3V14_12110 [Saprospiraceae bacterium]
MQTLSQEKCDDPINDISLNAANGCIDVFGSMICITVNFKADGIVILTSNSGNQMITEKQTYTVNNESNSVTICDDQQNCDTLLVIDGTLTSLPDTDPMTGCERTIILKKQ